MPEAGARRSFARSRISLIQLHGPPADAWQVRDYRNEPPYLIPNSESATVSQLETLL